MRRLLAATVSGVILVSGAGCSADAGNTAPGAPVTSTAGSAVGGSPAAPAASRGASAAPGTSGRAVDSGDAVLAANAGQLCVQARMVSGTAVSEFPHLQKELKAATTGQQKKLTGDRIRQTVGNWSFALNNLSRLVADPGLKKAFGAAGESARRLGAGDPAKITQDQLVAVQKDIDKACAGK